MATYTSSTSTDGWTLIASSTNGVTTYTLKKDDSVIYSGSNPTGSIKVDSGLTAFNKELFQGGAGYTGLSVNGQYNYYVGSSSGVSTLISSLSQMVQQTNSDITAQQQTATAPTDPATDLNNIALAPRPTTDSVNTAIANGTANLDNIALAAPPTTNSVNAASANSTAPVISSPPTVDANGVPLAIVAAGETPIKVPPIDTSALTASLPPIPDLGTTAPAAQPPTMGLTAGIKSAAGAATAQDQANFAAREDWRVRLALAPGANYLYNAKPPGILQPLFDTNGVIFPYTPNITVNYAANYEGTSLTHTNYKIYQYQNSSVDQVQLTCEFTCQDVAEANYLLAVIHFFKSMTKMFYGQDSDPKNGTPPPLCYIYGMGGYQFDALPLAISGFNYSLPQDVDYIKTTGASAAGTPQPSVQTAASTPGRLGAGITGGGRAPPPSYGTTTKSSSESATWVPTKIQLSITCLPVMSRNQVSNNFSLKDYATGKLVQGTKRKGGGFW